MLTQLLPSLITQKPTPSSEPQDRYRDVPLGVECAWPVPAASAHMQTSIPASA
jgi:hypothetical protein